MKISVIGTGYVGLVTGACLADVGHHVTCIDTNAQKIALLNNGEVPFYEPGLEKIISKNKKAHRLSFTSEWPTQFSANEIIFIAVGTPQGSTGAANLTYYFKAIDHIARRMNDRVIIVNKSTVPVGTAHEASLRLRKKVKKSFDIVSNPEFLREGTAVFDFKNPDRIVIGANSDRAVRVMKELYRGFDCPFVVTTPQSAELIKYAANSFLATKISFANELSQLCDVVNADVSVVTKGAGLDRRIGTAFLNAGIGYGGSCFPKDVQALLHISKKHKRPSLIVGAAARVNELQREYYMKKLKSQLGSLKGKKIAVWGLAFKPETDDVRESVAIDVVKQLAKQGARVYAYDPQAMDNAQPLVPSSVRFVDAAHEALVGADALCVLTEWGEFRTLNLKKMKRIMRHAVILDGRNQYTPQEIESAGFAYIGVGRSYHIAL